jgi:hypothetical protein
MPIGGLYHPLAPLFFQPLRYRFPQKLPNIFLQNGEQNPKSTAIADCCSYQQGVDI